MADFTSALYLGIDHGSRQLPGWDRLTLGKPAALEPPPGAEQVERDLARLVGCERALLGPSTLHLCLDLFPIVSRIGMCLFVDDCLYPVARWGVERSAALGIPVVMFHRHDVRALWQAIALAKSKRPVIVADGFCPACGRSVPLREYVDCASAQDGLIVLDDTQAIGIMGRRPGPLAPYGIGGGGSMSLAEVRDRRVVIVGSLAKAFGAPVAFVSGSHQLIWEFGRLSSTRVHCSPPSAAAIAAAARALETNRRQGEQLRWALAERVSRFRRGLGAMAGSPGLFPVQHLKLPRHAEPLVLHKQLRRRGVHTVLTGSGRGGPARIAFVLTARHENHEIDHALAHLAELTGRTSFASWGGGSGNGKSTDELRAFRSAAGASR